jgi:hypothetical protein
MAKNKKPTKKYKPRYAKDTLPVVYRFSQGNETDLQLIPHTSLSKFKEGAADSRDWHTLASRVNLGNTLAYTHYEGEVKTMMDRATQALGSVFKRHEKTGAWGCTGDEFNSMGDGLNLTDQMQKECTRRELQDAMAHVIEVAAVNRGRVPAKVMAVNLGL